MNKSKFLKKSLAALLAVMLVVAMIPLSAAAAYDAPITRFTVNGEEVTSSGKALSATVKSTANVLLGAVCPPETTLRYKDGDDAPQNFTAANNGWTATIVDLTAMKAGNVENTYVIPVIAETAVAQDDAPTTVEYTLTITYSPDAASADNEVKTVEKVQSKITENMTDYYIDNANNKITITVPFGTVVAAPDKTCFTYANDTVKNNAATAFAANASGITTDGTLTVVAANGNTRKYTVETVWESPFKSMAAADQTAEAKFKLDGSGDGQGKFIEIALPYGYKAKTGSASAGYKAVTLSFELADKYKEIYTKGVSAKVDNTSVEITSGKTKVDITGAAWPNQTIVLTLTKADDSTATVTLKLKIPEKNPEGLLKSIQVTGNSKSSNTVNVDESTRTINVEMPANFNFANDTDAKTATVTVTASKDATVTAVESDVKATGNDDTEVTLSNVDIRGQKITIRVQPQDTTKPYVDYTVNFTKAAAAENKLNNFTLKGKIGDETIERSAVWNGTTGTVTMPYAFRNPTAHADIKVYATASVGSTICLSDGSTLTAGFGSDYATMLGQTKPEVPAIDATGYTYVVNNTSNGHATYTIIIKTEEPRTQKSLISATLVGTNVYSSITADNTYAVGSPAKDSTGKNIVKVTLPYSKTATSIADDPYFSALQLSPGAAAYTVVRAADGTTTYEKIKTLDPDVKGAQSVAHINLYGTSLDNFLSAYNATADTVDTTPPQKPIPVYVVSEKYAALAADSITTANWATSDVKKYGEVYYLYGERAAAEKGSLITSMASTLDTNVTASVSNGTPQTVTITVPHSYNQASYAGTSADKTFSLNFALSKQASIYGKNNASAKWVSDLGKKDTSGKTEFCVVNGGLTIAGTPVTATNPPKLTVEAEDQTVREYELVVKVNDAETGYALTGVTATSGANKGSASISGTTATLTMPFGTKMFPTKLALTASKMATIYLEGPANTYTNVFDPDANYDLTNDIKVKVVAEDTRFSQIYTIKTVLGDRFSDVPANAWYAPYVAEAYDRGIVEGTGNGMFGPNTQITREQFAMMTWRMLGQPAPASASIPYSDADSISDWAKSAVAYCVEKNILNGYNDGTFQPKKTISREEAAKILAVALDLPITGTTSFADNGRISSWAVPYVAACQKAGVFNGDTANRFNPQAKITRAETAKVMVDSLKVAK